MTTVFETHFEDLGLFKRGKVRDIYEIEDKLLFVATDRISAYDVIMGEPVPEKGKMLTRISLYWFNVMTAIIQNHVVESDVDRFPESCKSYKDILEGRSLLVKKVDPLPVECIVRGYLSGSGLKTYRQDGTVCGIKLPDGLKESDRLPEPIFTPSTKGDLGEHDINISFDAVVDMIGRERAAQIRDTSLAIYKKGAEIADSKGIIIADTKFEFGLDGDDLILIDEILTPDSSRFWPKSAYVPGGPQPSFDKQYLRDYLSGIDWNKEPPPPPLPAEVIDNTRLKYKEAMEILVD